jgi:hypothetical protein
MIIFWLALKLDFSFRVIIYLEGFWPLGNNDNIRSIFYMRIFER